MLGALQSPIEQKVRSATKDDGYKPSERMLMEIADATHSYKHLPIIMKVIWKRLNDHTRNWKKLFKGLLVLEYIMKHGSEQVRIEVQVRRPEVQTLTMFQHGGTFDGKDIGLHVRDKAKEILEWLDSNPPGSKKKSAPAKSSAPSSKSSPHASYAPAPVHAAPYTPQPVPVPHPYAPAPSHYQPQPQPYPPQPQYGGAPTLHPNAYPQNPHLSIQPDFQTAPKPLPVPGGGTYGGQALPALPPKSVPAPPPVQQLPPSPQQPRSDDPFAAQHPGGFDPFATPSGNDPFARLSSPQQQGYGQNPFATPPRP